MSPKVKILEEWKTALMIYQELEVVIAVISLDNNYNVQIENRIAPRKEQFFIYWCECF